MRRINVLIACEESQTEMMAFRSRGFNAYSCDIQKPRRGADFIIDELQRPSTDPHHHPALSARAEKPPLDDKALQRHRA